MSQVNDSLIRGVFDDIVKFRPALAKYMIADEDEAEDSPGAIGIGADSKAGG